MTNTMDLTKLQSNLDRMVPEAISALEAEKFLSIAREVFAQNDYNNFEYNYFIKLEEYDFQTICMIKKGV
ncbi:MAG: hypothetical protein FWG90_10015 [Oscillospiraceae bacterium]|nr:hypothetical protein [Oscillospiraceae bacterium]